MHEIDTAVDVVVVGRRDVGEDIIEVVLGRSGGELFPVWEAGAHIDAQLDVETVRQYSLCGSPADRSRMTVAILREPAGRGGSVLAHDTLTVGARLSIRGPRNHFPLVRAAGYVFVAGGIGITPVLAHLEAAERTGAPWRLVYIGRGRDRMAYADELEETYGDRIVVHDSIASGRIDLGTALGQLPAGTAVYCCGPSGLIDAVEVVCEGISAVDVFVERFVPREAAERDTEMPFDVHLALSGCTLTVPPGRSILEVAEENAVVALSSCREGTCGTCETDVVVGEVDHRDSVLTPEERAEGETMMICVSRAACPRLVLEL